MEKDLVNQEIEIADKDFDAVSSVSSVIVPVQSKKEIKSLQKPQVAAQK